MKRAFRFLGLTAICVALAACGGGGGDASSTATGTFTAENFAAKADEAAQILIGSYGLAALVDPSRSSAGGPASVSSSAKRPLAMKKAQAIHQATVQCAVSGSLAVTMMVGSEDANTVGDKVSFTASNCDDGLGSVSGTMLGTLTSFAETATSASGSFSMRFDDFGTAALKINGTGSASAFVTETSAKVTFSFVGLSMKGSSSTVNLAHTGEVALSGSGASLGFSGQVSAGDQTFTLQQLQPFQMSGGSRIPTSGRLRISDSVGAYVDVVPGPNRYVYRYYAADNKSDTPDHTADGRQF
jgi:hypothetical protein